MKKSSYKMVFIVCAIFGMFFGLDQVKAQNYCEYEFPVNYDEKLRFRIVEEQDRTLSLDKNLYDQNGNKKNIDYKDQGGNPLIQDYLIVNKWFKKIHYLTAAVLDTTVFYDSETSGFKCPNLYVDYNVPSGLGAFGDKRVYQFQITTHDTTNATIISVKKWNTGDGEHVSDEEPVRPDFEKITGCSIFRDTKTAELVKKIVTMIKFAIPILVVILGIMDFITVVLSGEEKSMKEAGNRFIKRMVAGLLVIFVPAIIEFLIDLSGVLEPYGIQEIFCGF